MGPFEESPRNEAIWVAPPSTVDSRQRACDECKRYVMRQVLAGVC